MELRGLQKLTLVDYPGKVAATVFLGGCNFRCPYCHNPELIEIENSHSNKVLKEKDFFEFLEKRKNLLEGICLTGGEPTIQLGLPSFIKKIKKKGFLVKLDTNGSNPRLLEELIDNKLVDYVAMDIKTTPDKYHKVGAKREIGAVKKSVVLLKKGRVDYEFRTTVVPRIVNQFGLKKIGQWLTGAHKIVLQQFRPDRTLDKSFSKIKPYEDEKLRDFKKELEGYIDIVELRI